MSGWTGDIEVAVRVHALLCVARDMVMDAKMEARNLVPVKQMRTLGLIADAIEGGIDEADELIGCCIRRREAANRPTS